MMRFHLQEVLRLVKITETKYNGGFQGIRARENKELLIDKWVQSFSFMRLKKNVLKKDAGDVCTTL